MLLHQVSECTKLIIEAKDKHLAKLSSKLDNHDTVPKTYWSITKRFLNNKKIPIILSVLFEGKLISDFEKKAELFNNHFASQCSLVKNASTLPNLEYKTDERLNYFEINEDDTLSIIKNLNGSKVHRWDKISIRLIKLCGKTIAIPLKMIFRSMLEEGVFSDDWKKSNVVPIHKRDSKNLIKNYRPISLLPIFSKIFERLIFNYLLNYFIQNKLFTECQPGFIPGDSCVAQLLSIMHEIYKSFDCNSPYDIRGTFLDISKVFDKVWHKGLIFKLKSYGVDGGLSKLMENYFTGRQQRVVLNGQTSSWKNILAGVPQGSVLGPILFLIYINDLPNGIESICKIFADDTSLFSKVKDATFSDTQLNNDLNKISKWAFQWKMLFNPNASKQAIEICFSHKRDNENYPSLVFNDTKVQLANSQKHLQLILDSKLDCNEYIDKKINKYNKIIGIMKILSLILSRKSLLTIYKSFVWPNLDYADIIYDKPLNESLKRKIEMV